MASKPDSLSRFIRWGLASLVVAKFIPGFSTVAPPIAGPMRMGLPGFLLAAALGTGLWVGIPLGAGWILKDTIRTALASIDQQSWTGSVGHRAAGSHLAGLEIMV